MPILIGHLQIDPDRMHTIADAQRVVGSTPANITIVGDVEHYPETVLEYLLVRALRPMVALGAKVERVHYCREYFPLHLLTDHALEVARTPPEMTTTETTTPEKTYTLTLTENEMARVIHSLSVDAESLRALAEPFDSYALQLAEASEALRDRLREIVKPYRDPVAHVPTDERWAAERLHNL
jgi:hypothetical protein